MSYLRIPCEEYPVETVIMAVFEYSVPPFKQNVAIITISKIFTTTFIPLFKIQLHLVGLLTLLLPSGLLRFFLQVILLPLYEKLEKYPPPCWFDPPTISHLLNGLKLFKDRSFYSKLVVYVQNKLKLPRKIQLCASMISRWPNTLKIEPNHDSGHKLGARELAI